MNVRPDLSVVGKRQPRLDGREKVSGRSVFTDDVELPGMLYGKILRSPHARARIVSIDVSKAKKLPGVKAVVTADDAPGLMFNENQPLLCQDVVNYVGEEVAAVAATDEVTAAEACELIEVTYEPLPAVTSLKKALRPDAPQIHGQSPGNIALTFDKDWGDPEKTFDACDHVFVDEFKSPPQHNLLAEFHVAVADFSNPDRLSVWTPTQSAATYKINLAKAFGLSESQVHIAYLNIGGAFTGRGTPKPHHMIAALLSRTTARPVKVRAAGDEEFIMFRSSGEIMYRFRTGVTKDGIVKAIEADITIESGAHPERSMLVWLPAGYLNWLYTVESVRYRGRMVYTNNVPRASHHGGIFGRMSAGWMQHLNHVAEGMGMDPLDFHLKNAVEQGHVTNDGNSFDSCGLKECIEKAAERSGWKDKYGKLPPYHGIGIGIGAMASGSKGLAKHDTSAAMVKVADDGIVTLYTGIPDMGQGSHTTMAIIAAEVLGVHADDVRVVAGDSDITPFDWGAFTQRGTFVTGNGVKNAAEDALQQLQSTAAKEFDADPADIVFRDRQVYPTDRPDEAVSFASIAFNTLHSQEGRFVMGRGFYNAPNKFGSMAYSFGAQIAEVEVDPETGAVTVHKVTVAHDLGRAMNPLAVEGQLDGQVFSGLSQVLYEECLQADGQTLNPSRLEYKLPRTYELPEVEHIIVETIDPHGPFGAKEVGEGPIVVTMSAVASAVANALGGMMPEIPMTPWRVLRAIKQRDLDIK